MLVAPVVQDVHEDVRDVLVHVQHLVQGHVVIVLPVVVRDAQVAASLVVPDVQEVVLDVRLVVLLIAMDVLLVAVDVQEHVAVDVVDAVTVAGHLVRGRVRAATVLALVVLAHVKDVQVQVETALLVKVDVLVLVRDVPDVQEHVMVIVVHLAADVATVAQVDAQGDVLLVQDVQVLAQEIALLLVRMDAVQDAKHLALVVLVVAQDVLLDVGQDVLLLVLLHAVQRVIRNVQEHVMVLQAGNVLIKKGINMKRKFEIPEDVSDYLQRLSFEKMSREDVIDRIITSHKDDPDASVLDSVVFNHYMKALIEVTAEYEQAKRKVPDYFPDDIDDATDVNWTLDFDTYTVTIDA